MTKAEIESLEFRGVKWFQVHEYETYPAFFLKVRYSWWVLFRCQKRRINKVLRRSMEANAAAGVEYLGVLDLYLVDNYMRIF